MRRVVWKYHLSRGRGVDVLELPGGASFVRADMQEGIICIWFLVDRDEPKVERRFSVYGTGQDVPDTANYVGTVMDGPFVWHVFERLEPHA